MVISTQEALAQIIPLLWTGFILAGIALVAENWKRIELIREDWNKDGDPPALP